MKKFADFNVFSLFFHSLRGRYMTHRLHLRRDADEWKEKKKGKKRKLGHATKSEQQLTTQFSPMLPRINRIFDLPSKKGASHFWILWLIVESSISASHNKPECSRAGTEETFNRFNGSASVQLTVRDWHHTIILVGDRLDALEHHLSHDSRIWLISRLHTLEQLS